MHSTVIKKKNKKSIIIPYKKSPKIQKLMNFTKTPQKFERRSIQFLSNDKMKKYHNKSWKVCKEKQKSKNTKINEIFKNTYFKSLKKDKQNVQQ